METENTLSKTISAAGDKAAYDAACKRLLANKIILAWIMKSCLQEFRDISVEEIAEKYIEGQPQIAQVAVYPDEKDPGDGELIQGSPTEDSSMTEGTVTFDIRFRAIAPGAEQEYITLIINVEAQNDFYPGYPIIKRGIYYCSRMISSQYGVEFTKSHFEKIKKVYSIWVCAHPPQYRQNTINRYRIREEHLVGEVREAEENYDLLTAIIIGLGKPGDEKYTGILKLLEVLLSSERPPEEKKRILQEDFQIKMTYALESEVQTMCNLSKGIEEKALYQGLTEGLAQGMQQGLQQGMQQGLQQGMQQATLTSIRNLMVSLNMTEDQAMAALQLSDADKEKYRELLHQKQ